MQGSVCTFIEALTSFSASASQSSLVTGGSRESGTEGMTAGVAVAAAIVIITLLVVLVVVVLWMRHRVIR